MLNYQLSDNLKTAGVPFLHNERTLALTLVASGQLAEPGPVLAPHAQDCPMPHTSQLYPLPSQSNPQGADPSPSTRGKTGRNNLNEEITPLLPTGIGEQYSQTIQNLGHAAILRRCELPV
jgi:hypothetical protein